MKTEDFNYYLPPELIAHEPAHDRDHSRLMVLERKTKKLKHKHFYDVVDYLYPGDLLVLNDTKVIPANLVGKKVESGAKIAVLLIRSWDLGVADENVWLCLVKPGKKLKVGSKISFGEGELVGEVVEKLEGGEQIIKFEAKGDFWATIYQLGQVPLPPYIKTRDSKLDTRSRYQTVYADKEGASAAPTAGLHFTPEILEKIKNKGVKIVYVTLHTGLGTFQPVRTDNIEDHLMHSEWFSVSVETIEAVKRAKRVIAVGTTVVRTLETIFASKTEVPAFVKTLTGNITGESDLFIYPGYKFKVVDALITNFHWPKSTLIMLVSAFAQRAVTNKFGFAKKSLADKSAFVGRDFIMKAYQEAIKEKYRFYSFGDAMLIL